MSKYRGQLADFPDEVVAHLRGNYFMKIRC